MHQHKIFIIGLPRTATTSVCVALLEQGFKTAHTAYTRTAIEQAQVIADTPVFCDYPDLDKRFANAKFIHLNREMNAWLPSIKQLLNRMYINLQRADGGFNPHIKRCYQHVFSPLNKENINDDDFLTACYTKHFNQAQAYFKHRPNDFLSIDVSAPNSYQNMLSFLNVNANANIHYGFKPINLAGKVTAWNDIKDPNKIPSTHNGRIDKIL